MTCYRLNGIQTESGKRTNEVYSKKILIKGLKLKTALEIYEERAQFLRDIRRNES